MPTNARHDWKFLATIFAAVAGVAVPVWLWQADLTAKSVSVVLTSLIQLQPNEKDSFEKLDISIDGEKLASPYVGIFELRNDGSKPIPASDFEGPLEIRLEQGSSFARARVTSKIPPDIETEISTEKQKLSIKPTLLNPKDSVKITVLTAGSPPKFSSKIRIVGVSGASLQDIATKKQTSAMPWLVLAFAIPLLLASMLAFDGATERDGVHLRKRAAAFVALATGFPAGLGLKYFMDSQGFDGFWQFMFAVIGVAAIGMLLGVVINRKVQPHSAANEP